MKTLLLTLAIFIAWGSQAQNLKSSKDGVYSGVIRVKFMPSQTQMSEQISMKLKQAQVQQSDQPVIVQTGIQQFDVLNAEVKAVNMKRVFRPAGKFEAKHKAFGLHLWYEIEYSSQQELDYVINKYQSLPEVEIAEEIRVAKLIDEVPDIKPSGISATNDPSFSQQWHYHNTGQTGGTAGADISLLAAWQKETGHSDVVVAVIDGGIDPDHPDLTGNFWVNANEIPGNNIDDDNNGYIDDVNGYNFVNNSGSIVGHSHGTHVAGTVAAETNNGQTVAGVAGGSGTNDGVRLMSCQVFTNTGANGFAESFVYASDNGAVISQNSWGYKYPNASLGQAEKDAIDYFIANSGGPGSPVSGGIVIFAAGNDNSDSQGNLHWYPGYYSAVMAVASTDHNDNKSIFSNFGTWVDIAAPGSAIISTRNGGGFESKSGTSMACPHVSGVAALIASQAARNGTQITASEIWNKLVNNIDPIDNLNPSYVGKLGSGRLNADKALQVIQQQVPATPTGLTATAGADQVTISWNASQYATSYNVQIKEVGGTWATTNVGATTTTVTATPNTTYEYRVNAENSLGSSAYSATNTITTVDKTYCASSGTNFSYEWISSVQIGSLTNSSNASGYSDFTAQKAMVNAGEVVNVELTPGFQSTTYTEFFTIWIDYNNDKDFADANEQVFTGSGTAAVTGQFTVPSGLNVETRMRVSMKYQGAATPCETFSYGEVEDYTIVISQGTVNPPSVPTGLTIGTVGSTTFDFSWNASADATSYDVQTRTAVGTWATFNTTNTTYQYTGATANTSYEYRVSAKNAAGSSAYTSVQTVTTQPVASAYCPSKSTNVKFEYLDLVQLNEINNVTGANGGYGDFTNLTATLAKGSSQTIYLSAGFASSSYTEYYMVWIDYNMNGVFDADEVVAQGASSLSTPLSYNFTVPSTALSGTTRMRVSMKWNSYASPCEEFSYGEVEDYTVLITETGTAALLKSARAAEPLEYMKPGADFRIYPNPVEEELFIGFKGDVVNYVIYNSAGSAVMNGYSNGSRRINVSGLSNGLYFIKVISDGKVVTTRFVKK